MKLADTIGLSVNETHFGKPASVRVKSYVLREEDKKWNEKKNEGLKYRDKKQCHSHSVDNILHEGDYSPFIEFDFLSRP